MDFKEHGTWCDTLDELLNPSTDGTRRACYVDEPEDDGDTHSFDPIMRQTYSTEVQKQVETIKQLTVDKNNFEVDGILTKDTPKTQDSFMHEKLKTVVKKYTNCVELVNGQKRIDFFLYTTIITINSNLHFLFKLMKQFFIDKSRKFPRVKKMNILLVSSATINNNTAIEFLKRQPNINLYYIPNITYETVSLDSEVAKWCHFYGVYKINFWKLPKYVGMKRLSSHMIDVGGYRTPDRDGYLYLLMKKKILTKNTCVVISDFLYNQKDYTELMKNEKSLKLSYQNIKNFKPEILLEEFLLNKLQKQFYYLEMMNATQQYIEIQNYKSKKKSNQIPFLRICNEEDIGENSEVYNFIFIGYTGTEWKLKAKNWVFAYFLDSKIPVEAKADAARFNFSNPSFKKFIIKPEFSLLEVLKENKHAGMVELMFGNTSHLGIFTYEEYIEFNYFKFFNQILDRRKTNLTKDIKDKKEREKVEREIMALTARDIVKNFYLDDPYWSTGHPDLFEDINKTDIYNTK